MIKFEKISETAYYNELLKELDDLTTEDQLQNEVKYFKDALPLPKRGTTNSAGYDFYAPRTFIVNPGEKVKVSSGIKCQLDPDKVLLIFPRSSIGYKKNIMIANTTGIIDSDYYNNISNEGHIMIFLKNIGDTPVTINRGDKIVQAVIVKYYTTEDDNTDEERKGGVGSTDSKNTIETKILKHEDEVKSIKDHINSIGTTSAKLNNNNKRRR